MLSKRRVKHKIALEGLQINQKHTLDLMFKAFESERNKLNKKYSKDERFGANPVDYRLGKSKRTEDDYNPKNTNDFNGTINNL
jgi:hypothetical protein